MNGFAGFAIFVVVLVQTACAQSTDFASTDFSKADSIANLHVAHPLTHIRSLAINLTQPLATEQEKFRAIFIWVCNNLEVDYELVLINRRKTSSLSGKKLDAWRKIFNEIAFEKLLKEQKTLCSGYAYVVRELAFHAGLHCEIINGYAKPGGLKMGSSYLNHSWNRIKINAKWYYCDATWASGVFNRSTGTFTKKYRYEYFLADPDFFSREHRIL